MSSKHNKGKGGGSSSSSRGDPPQQPPSRSASAAVPNRQQSTASASSSSSTIDVAIHDQPVADAAAAAGRKGLYEMKSLVEQQLARLCALVQPVWCFQPDVIRKAHKQLLYHLFDEYGHIYNLKNSILNKKILGSIIDLPSLVQHYHTKVMKPYRKWCKISFQSYKDPADGDAVQFGLGNVSGASSLTRDQLTMLNMLLLFCVWGEIDVLRIQNNITLLMFHSAKHWLGLPSGGKVAVSPAKLKKNEDKFGPLPSAHCQSVGDLMRYEASYLLELVEVVGFNRKLRNEHYLAWEDINTTSACKPFVGKYLKWYSWQRCYRLSKDSSLHLAVMNNVGKNDALCLDDQGKPLAQIPAQAASSAADGARNDILDRHQAQQQHQQQQAAKDVRSLSISMPGDGNASKQPSPLTPTPTPLKTKDEQKQIKELRKKELDSKKDVNKTAAKKEKERRWFVRTWKTYFDRAGGPFGLIGYLTMAHNFSIPIYVQLIFFSIMLYIFVDVPTFNNIRTSPIATVVLCAFPLVIAGIMLAAQILLLQWFTRPLLHPYKFWLPGRGRWSFRFGNPLNYVIWLLVLVSQGAICRFLVFQVQYNATQVVLQQFAKNQYDILSLVIYILSWVPVFFVYWTVAPILFNLWTAAFSFIYAVLKRINRITSWRGFKRYLRSRDTLKHFQHKLLGPENKDLPIESVQYRFALFFNGIIEDYYEEYMCSYNQKRKLSFHLSKFHEKQQIPVDEFKKQVKKITSVTPKNEQFARFLIRFLNNLYQNMPASVGVESMRRLNIVTPVYKEAVMYSWEELIELQNTDTSFLRHLISRHEYDWKNFRDKELEFRAALLHIEQKVLSNVDMRGHYVPPELKLRIRLWASKRFQSVARTIEGMCKTAKALRLLLKVQTLHTNYTDLQLDAIVRDKFKYIVGAQVLDRSTWGAGEDLSRYVDDFLYMLSRNGEFMKLAYQRKVGNHWEGVLLGKKTAQSAIEQECRVFTFGKFDNKGQGKPAHQAFLMQFFDGTVAQTIDCNQDGNIGQMVFVPNIVQEFSNNKNVKIVGFPEYIFTEKWSIAGYSAALVEKTFGSLIQRSWAMLGMRMHYGHPDMIEGLWAMFTTGLSKMSYVSEDIFTGFDTVINGGRIKYVDYIEVGKARDVCLFSTSKFNRKTSGGAAQMAVSREVQELMFGLKLNPAERLTFLYTTLAHYTNTILVLVSTYIVFFLRVIMLILRFFQTPDQRADDNTAEIWRVLDVVFILQLGMTLAIPAAFEMILDRGIIRGIYDYIIKLKILIVSIYSIFHLLHQALFFHMGFIDAAQYLASGRGAGLAHESIGKIVIAYDTSHFLPALLIFILAVVGLALGQSVNYFLYVLVISFIWLWSPFLFNRGSFPLDVGYGTWIKLFAKDIEYVKKWKIMHIITEMAKRKKNVNKVEKHQQELLERSDDYHNAWFPDVEDIDEDAIDPDGDDIETVSVDSGAPAMTRGSALQFSPSRSVGHSSITLTNRYSLRRWNQLGYNDLALHIDDRFERDFKFKQERQSRYRVLSFARKVIIYIQAVFWNIFLLITLTGIKYVSILLGLLQLVFPLTVPGKREVENYERHSASVEKRFLKIQGFVRDVTMKQAQYRKLMFASTPSGMSTMAKDAVPSSKLASFGIDPDVPVGKPMHAMFGKQQMLNGSSSSSSMGSDDDDMNGGSSGSQAKQAVLEKRKIEVAQPVPVSVPLEAEAPVLEVPVQTIQGQDVVIKAGSTSQRSENPQIVTTSASTAGSSVQPAPAAQPKAPTPPPKRLSSLFSKAKKHDSDKQASSSSASSSKPSSSSSSSQARQQHPDSKDASDTLKKIYERHGKGRKGGPSSSKYDDSNA